MAETALWPTNDSDRPVWQGADARQRLGELEIDLESILAGLRAGDLAERQTDEFSPVTAAGTERWNHTVQELRRNLAMLGWRVQNPNNSPRIVRPDGELSIAVVSGNANTGNPNREPSNAHALGPTVDESVLRNRAREVVGSSSSTAWKTPQSRTPSIARPSAPLRGSCCMPVMPQPGFAPNCPTRI